jgi:hypothetical protein
MNELVDKKALKNWGQKCRAEGEVEIWEVKLNAAEEKANTKLACCKKQVEAKVVNLKLGTASLVLDKLPPREPGGRPWHIFL